MQYLTLECYISSYINTFLWLIHQHSHWRPKEWTKKATPGLESGEATPAPWVALGGLSHGSTDSPSRWWMDEWNDVPSVKLMASIGIDEMIGVIIRCCVPPFQVGNWKHVFSCSCGGGGNESCLLSSVVIRSTTPHPTSFNNHRCCWQAAQANIPILVRPGFAGLLDLGSNLLRWKRSPARTILGTTMASSFLTPRISGIFFLLEHLQVGCRKLLVPDFFHLKSSNSHGSSGCYPGTKPRKSMESP